MNLRSNLSTSLRALRLALPILVISTAPFASAVELFRGTINLPMQARWNDAVLKPGAYTISVVSDSGGTPFLHIRGREGDQFMIVGPADKHEPPKGSRLLLVKAGNTYVVRQFDAGTLGKSFSFKTPKELGKLSSSNGPSETVVAMTTDR